MKNLSLTYGLLLFLMLCVSCAEEDNDLSFVESAIAPTDVSLFTSITQDNTGLVTLTPSGTGVNNYTIYFGDDSEVVENIEPGSSIEHVYEEGVYEVTIIAYGAAGDKTEITKSLTVSFNPPENVEVSIENDPGISKQVNITTSADFATVYEVYFGEDENEEPLTANIEETISYIYAEPGTYTITVIVKGGAIQTTEYTEEFLVTEILQPVISAPAPPTRASSDVISVFSSAYDNIAGANYFPDWGQAGQGSGWTCLLYTSDAADD